MLLSDFPSDIWRFIGPHLEENDIERLLMSGSRRLLSSLAHNRTNLKIVWTSPKFLELPRILSKWSYLTSISIRSKQSELLLSWPAPLALISGALLTSLRLVFRHCIDLVFSDPRLNQRCPNLEILDLEDLHTTTPLIPTISIASLPSKLRIFRLSYRGFCAYSSSDIAHLPSTLEHIVIGAYICSVREGSWNDSIDDQFAAEAVFPCPNLRTLHAKELYVHLTKLPPSLTDLKIEAGSLLDCFTPSTPTRPAAAIHVYNDPISLKKLFPNLRRFYLRSEIGFPYNLLDDLPPSLTSVDVEQWGNTGPHRTSKEILDRILPFAAQFRHFNVEGATVLPEIACRLPNLQTFNIYLDYPHEVISEAPSPYSPTLTTLSDLNGMWLHHLPSTLTSLTCIKIYSFPPYSESPMLTLFPSNLRSFNVVRTDVPLTESIILALPTSLTDLRISIPHQEFVWKTLSQHLQHLVHLEASDTPPEIASCPPTAALLPRRLRVLHISAVPSIDSSTNGTELPLYGSWFREGLADLSSLEKLVIASADLHPDLLKYCPPQLKYLQGPPKIVELVTAASLPQLESIVAPDYPYSGDFKLYPVLDPTLAGKLPRSLTHLWASKMTYEGNASAFVDALPPYLSTIQVLPLIKSYYLRKKVLCEFCDPVLVKFNNPPASQQF